MKDGLFRSSVTTAVAVAASLILTSGAAAQNASSVSTPRTPDGKPDLSGFWGATPRDEVVDDGAGNLTREFPSRRCGPNQVDCDIRTNQSADGQLAARYDPNRPLYKPEHWDRIQELDANTNFDDPIMKCQPTGVPRMGPPTKILQTANEVVLFYAAPGASTQPQDFRIIPIDGRKHDRNRSKTDWTYYGYSVGSWEGDTLVVDSVGFNDITWLARGGYFHSDQMRVRERFRREGNILHYHVTVEDPVVLLEPWVMNPRQLRLNTDPNVYIPEGSPCKDVDTDNIVLKIRH
jgi:hypothetical protein